MDRDKRVATTIQFMMSKGCVSSDEFVAFLQTLRQEHQSQFTDDKVVSAISNINDRLKKYNMMIRYSLDDRTNERYYSLINTVDNEVTRKALLYSDKEFEFFKLIFENLQNGPSPLSEILELTPHVNSKRKEDLVDEWISKLWLQKDDDFIRLGPRSKAELDVLMDHAMTSENTQAGHSTSRSSMSIRNNNSSQAEPSTSRSSRPTRGNISSQDGPSAGESSRPSRNSTISQAEPSTSKPSRPSRSSLRSQS